jgi:hypothetical protein
MPPKKTLKQLAVEKKKQSAVKHKEKPIKVKGRTIVGATKYDVVSQPKVVRWVDDRPTDVLKSADKTNKSFLIQQGPQGVRLVADPTKPESYKTSKVLIEQVGTVDPKIIVKAPQERPTFKPFAPTPMVLAEPARGIEAIQYMTFEKDKGKYMPNPVSESQIKVFKRPFRPYKATELRTHNRRYDAAIAFLTPYVDDPLLLDSLATEFALSQEPSQPIKDKLAETYKGTRVYAPKNVIEHFIYGKPLKPLIKVPPAIPPRPAKKPSGKPSGAPSSSSGAPSSSSGAPSSSSGAPSSSSGAPSSSSGAPSGPKYDPKKTYMVLNKPNSYVSGKYGKENYTGAELNADPTLQRSPKEYTKPYKNRYNSYWLMVAAAMGAPADNNFHDKAQRKVIDATASKFAVFVDAKEMAGENGFPYVKAFDDALRVLDDFGRPKYTPEFIVEKIVSGQEADLKGSGISESMANKLVGKKPVKMPKPYVKTPKLMGSGQSEQVLQPEQVYPVHHPTADDVQRNNIRRYLMEIKSSKPSDVPEHIRVEGWRNPVVSREYTTQDDSVLLGERIRSSTHEINKAKAAGKSIIASPAYYVPFMVSV